MVASPALVLTDTTWSWRGFPIRYQQAGSTGPAVVLIHGFGASSDHWRKTIPDLAQSCRVFALDLIGFGRSAKPQPGTATTTTQIAYTFETWGEQIAAFCQEIVGDNVILVGNSIGCVAALQAAVLDPDRVVSVVMLNCSLRLLHDRKRSTLPWHRRFSAPIMQSVLGYRPIGHLFFSRLAKPEVIRKILLQAYRRSDAITSELVDLLLEPALDPGAADVFLAFVRYSQGPLAEDLLAQLQCPVLILWGANDPWEPIDLAQQELAHFPVVKQFVALDGVGHCPQDEAPELVNPILETWIKDHGVCVKDSN